MVTLKNVIEELDRLFAIFNQHYYGGQLIKPVISIQRNDRNRLTLGWCSTKKVWKELTTGEFYYEINLSAEFLFRGVAEICETLLHEMVHLSNLQRDIQDCSRGGTYHNRRYKDVAEKCGLVVTHHSTYGWATTELSDETKLYINSLHLNSEMFNLTRETPGIIEILGPAGALDGAGGTDNPTKSKSNSRKYVCPTCKQSVRATKEVNIICGDCQQPMTVEN